MRKEVTKMLTGIILPILLVYIIYKIMYNRSTGGEHPFFD